MRLFLLVMSVHLSTVPLVLGQDAAPTDTSVEQPPDWQLETLLLKDGVSYSGMVQSVTDTEIEFIQVFRRPGEPMSAIVRVVAADQVKELGRLPDDQHKVLERRIRQFKHRAAIEAGSMERLALTPLRQDGVVVFAYAGPWFRLESTADEEATRRCIVRIEQIYRAFRHVVPPRGSSDDRVRIILHGSLDEYRTALRHLGLDIENLAFYSPQQNVIIAGAELSSYSRQLAVIRQQHIDLLQQAELRDQRFRTQLQELRDKLAAQGLSREQIKDEMALRNAAWNKEQRNLQRLIAETNRRNDARFAEVTGRMFERLYHEAFHAYLQRHLLTEPGQQVDRWLNEGLAQVFESGQLDADTLRLDAPKRQSLAFLQRDLTGLHPLSLAELLNTRDHDFLVTHAGGTSERHYAYAWGLAYYLTTEAQILTGEQLDAYFSDREPSRIERFQRLVEMPLAEFEARWRDFILAAPREF